MWLEYFEQYLDRVFPRFLSEKLWNYKDDLCIWLSFWSFCPPP